MCRRTIVARYEGIADTAPATPVQPSRRSTASTSRAARRVGEIVATERQSRPTGQLGGVVAPPVAKGDACSRWVRPSSRTVSATPTGS